MTLAELQQLFQAGVLRGEADAALLGAMKAPPRGDKRGDRFAIYSDGYRLRHAEFLSNDFPALREAVGDEIFGAMVEAYIGARPSTFRNARWYGAGLPAFLRATPPFSADAFACALATLEGALGRAFDAPDTAPLAIDALTAMAEDDWPALRMALHPSAALIEASGAAMAAYRAFREDSAQGDETEEGECEALVWRNGLEVQYRSLAALEALALREVLAGARFGEICGLMAFARPGEPAEDLTARAAGFLVQWFGDGLIVEVRTTAE